MRSLLSALIKFTESYIIHDAVLSTHSLQLYGGNLHQESVLVAVELEQVVVQLRHDPLAVATIQVS